MIQRFLLLLTFFVLNTSHFFTLYSQSFSDRRVFSTAGRDLKNLSLGSEFDKDSELNVLELYIWISVSILLQLLIY